MFSKGLVKTSIAAAELGISTVYLKNLRDCQGGFLKVANTIFWELVQLTLLSGMFPPWLRTYNYRIVRETQTVKQLAEGG